MANIIFIDNFDSFSYNLVDQFRSLSHEVTIYRNTISIETLKRTAIELENAVFVLSPGPGVPSKAGVMPKLINTFKGQIPIIGICLGHQAIVEAYGGKVIGADNIVHGKVSMMHHNNHACYHSLPSPFTIARYHSLVTTDIPEQLDVTAEVEGLVMSVANDRDKVCGFQFHPESIMTTHGAKLLANVIDWAQSTNR